MPVDSGFILTRHQIEQDNQHFLVFWLATLQGPLRVVSEPQKTVFFAAVQDRSKIETQLKLNNISHEIKLLPMKTCQDESAIGVYFCSQRAAFRARECLKEQMITLYEEDIRSVDRYLMERFIYGSAQVRGRLIKRHGYQEMVQARLGPCESVSPELTLVSLDIECSRHGELFSIGMAGESQKWVVMIGPHSADSPDWIEWVEDEVALLRRFIELFNQFDPDIVIGWAVVSFDFQLLVKRAEKYAIPLRLGRDNSCARWRKSRIDGHAGFIDIEGRVVLDGIDALKSASYQFDSFSLESVAQSLLGRGKDTEDVANRLETIEHDFVHNKVKLARYNLEDCLLVLDIFENTKLLDYLRLRSQLTGLELDRLGGSVAAFTNLYLPKFHRAGLVAPNRPADGGLASPGGYVMNSRPGLYQHVVVLDFKSLYPSIIRTFKIDPLGLIRGLQQPEDSIPGYKGAVFSRQEHFLPDIITSLWQQRDEAKKQQDQARSQAIKILMNSFYGVLGSGGCRFYDTRLASSITMRGHNIMQTTAQWIEQAGYQVIYGDTDSTFVWLEGNRTNQEAKDIGLRLQEQINQAWQEKIAQEFDLPCYLEIEFETHFSQFLMPTIRGSELGSKKRYAGLKQSDKGAELVFKGLETVRSDWTELAKQFQVGLYQRVFAQQPVDDFVQQTLDALRTGHSDHLLYYRKRLRQKLSHYVKNVPPHVKAARLADEHLLKQGLPQQYQNKGWISYLVTHNGPEPKGFIESSIDYEHYVEKQLRPIADSILPFVGQSFEQLASQQLGLF